VHGVTLRICWEPCARAPGVRAVVGPQAREPAGPQAQAPGEAAAAPWALPEIHSCQSLLGSFCWSPQSDVDCWAASRRRNIRRYSQKLWKGGVMTKSHSHAHRPSRDQRRAQPFERHRLGYSFNLVGDACFLRWRHPLHAGDLMGLQQDCRQARAQKTARMVLIMSIPAHVPAPSSGVRNAITAMLHALLDCCREVFVSIEHDHPDRELLRALFHSKGHTRTSIVESIDEALARAQGLVPRDVLELQRVASYLGRACDSESH
jgi:hypothetical protein